MRLYTALPTASSPTRALPTQATSAPFRKEDSAYLDVDPHESPVVANSDFTGRSSSSLTMPSR